MQLDQITIAGITKFPADAPVTLSLQDFPEGSLIAIRGLNGQGKTTLLDSILAPLFLTMPSRRGKLFTYAPTSDAFLEGTYALDDMLIRARVAIDGPRRSVKPVLDISHPNGQRTVSEDAGVKTYQADIARIFPPLELALASAFAPQNRAGSFVSATAAERKTLFGICLGLEQYAQWAETAAKAAQLVRTAAAKLEGRHTTLDGLTHPGRKAELLERLELAGETLARVQQKIADLEAERQRETTVRATLAKDLEGRVRAEEAHRAAQAAAVASADEGVALARDRKEHATRVSQETARALQAETTAEERINLAEVNAKASRASAVKEPISRIAGNQTLQRRAEEIKAAAAKLKEANDAIGAERTAMTDYQRELDDQLQGLEADQANLAPLEKAEAELEEARRQVEIVERVPCQGRLILLTVDAMSVGSPEDKRFDRVDASTCQFLTEAKAAGRRIVELEERADLAPVARRAKEARQAVIAGLRQTLGGCRRNIEGHELTLRQVRELAAYAPELERAEERIAGYQAAIDQADKVLADRLLELETERTHVREHRRQVLDELKRQETEAAARFQEREAALLAKHEAADDALRAALAELERTARTVDDVSASDLKLVHLARAEKDAEGDRVRWETELKTVEGELAEMARQRQELERVEANLNAADAEVLVWEMLAKVFSRDGLPTLEIANAGPTVSSLTNELLEVAFGPRFTVEVVTQVPTADGKGWKEDFTIRVYDNDQAGQVRDIADLSGGERVLVEEALRAAIMVFVNNQNRTPFRTICRDETTGALDPENAVRYVAMLRRLVKLAGAAHCLFITHNEECAELADVVVTVHDGTLDVRRTAA